MIPRIVTVCVQGKTARNSGNDDKTRAKITQSRLDLAEELALTINGRWGELDAILFPGGFLFSNAYIGNLSYIDRVKALDRTGLVSPIIEIINKLSRSPKAFIASGIDSADQLIEDDEIGGDQLYVAWNSLGVAGIGRKFYATDEHERDSLVFYTDDYSSTNRSVSVSRGNNAILCACYDGFGICHMSERTAIRGHDWSNHILNIGDDASDIASYHTVDTETLQTLRNEFCANLEGINMAWVAIHSFNKNAGRWPQNMLKPASSLYGAAYAAAHFRKLPSSGDVSVLAALDGELMKPADWFAMKSGRGSAMIRLFS